MSEIHEKYYKVREFPSILRTTLNKLKGGSLDLSNSFAKVQ